MHCILFRSCYDIKLTMRDPKFCSQTIDTNIVIIPVSSGDIAAAIPANAQLVLQVGVKLCCKVLLPQCEQGSPVILWQFSEVFQQCFNWDRT